ncbi:MAG: 5-formyltetrahydrofolate cyclo-ligase [Bacteroides sp.]|nr:5-formyltetrahydrofolate cyclo-ligase [Eubacterium sp.]MCM1417251.1 5-formyltetrahydrofolate cyclo-ligase [Roseburia sp.]MCM1461129.1 5-formyltetrahydrofolate cyclo-ligase [Bacteroides sp.]
MSIGKPELRRELLLRRRSMDKSTKKEYDDSIHTKLTELIRATEPRAILSYLSTELEVGTIEFLREMILLGKAVYAPRCENGIMRFFRLYDLSALKKGAFGIPEPSGSEEFFGGRDSVCITPALMFSRDGYRLGYGGGYYDRFLGDYDGLSVGICYDSFIGEIPREAFDRPVRLLITEKETIDLR